MSGRDPIQNAVRKVAQEHLTQGPDTSVREWIVACSGGVDSMVLLHALKAATADMGIQLRAVHVNHGIRAEAEADERFVVDVCNDWSIPVSVERIDLSSLPLESRRSVEADARMLRYRALHRVARKSPAPRKVFLGHHGDDQIETVLLRLLRGTSLSGLGGIRPVRYWRDTAWIRPFLSVGKATLQEYADLYQIPYVEDETNSDNRYARNFLRNTVIPKLKELQPNLTAVVERETALWREEDDWLQDYCHHVMEQCAKCVNGGWRIDIPSLQANPLPLQRRIIKIILYYCASNDWTFDHVESILLLCGQNRPSGQLSLPAGVLARRVYAFLEIQGASPSVTADPPDESYQYDWDLTNRESLSFDLTACQLRWTFRRRLLNDEEALVRPNLLETVLPWGSEVHFCPSVGGERIQLLGMGGSKKVSDAFTDRKVPRHLRFLWPCCYVEGKLIWIPGVARSRHNLVSAGEPGWIIQSEVTDLQGRTLSETFPTVQHVK